MRFAVTYNLSKDTIPIDYRSGFISLIKKAMATANKDLYKKFYEEDQNVKPYTFSIYSTDGFLKCGDEFKVGNTLVFNFSTNSYEIGTYIYNGLVDDEMKIFPFFEGNQLKRQKAMLLQEPEITSSTAVFKTMSTVLINSIGKKDWYFIPDNPEFKDAFDTCVTAMVNGLLGINNAKVIFNPIKLKRQVVKHYRGNMQGFEGIFALSGDREVLQLIHAVGLGVRRSQGFGMLRVMR
ncbi:MAG: CRISPR-associated endoribonuclease Cas6 [Candidatus Brocadia sp.]